MPNTIKPKRSNTGGTVPTTSNLTSGEIGVNMADKKVYINNGTSVVQIGAGDLAGLGDTNITSPTNGQSLQYNSATGKWVNASGSGSGDVVGPSSATDNALARFDGTTGKLIQNGTVTQDDNGTLASVNGISFRTSPVSAPTAAGSMFWDSGNGTPSIVLDANTTLQLGQENIALVYNGTGSTIANGSVVAVSGAQGQRPSVVLADADSEALSAPTLGIATEDIANGAEGFVCTFGLVRGLNTSAFTDGAPIYLSQTAGAFTATRPSAPAHTVFLGWVVRSHVSSGEVFVHISNGWELDELHNVLITSATSGNTLIYDAVAGVWENANLTAGTGISVTNGAGSISIANSGVTSAVAGTGIGVSGATGAVTITNNGVTSFSAGTTGLTPSTGTTGAVTLAGTLAVANGGTGSTTASGARTNLGATTVGGNLFTLTNPSAVTFPRFNADNTVSSLSATDFRTAIGAGTGNGTVTGVTATSPVASSGGTAPVISLSSGYGDTQNPYASKTANFVLAAPNGTSGAPTFRALVAADIPTLNQNTTGSAATLTTGRTIGMTGDVTWTSASFNGSANVTGTSTLATVNSNVGTFGSSSAIPVITVNAKGLVTAVSTQSVAGGQYFGSATTKAIAYNANTIGENVTVTTGNNGLSAGPITISSGFTVTVESGAVWVIV